LETVDEFGESLACRLTAVCQQSDRQIIDKNDEANIVAQLIVTHVAVAVPDARPKLLLQVSSLTANYFHQQ